MTDDAELEQLTLAVKRDLERVLEKHEPIPSFVALTAFTDVLMTAVVRVLNTSDREAVIDMLAGMERSLAIIRERVQAAGTAH